MAERAMRKGWYNFRNRMEEQNICVSFLILQEYDNLQNGTADHTMIGWNRTLTLCLTNCNPNPNQTNPNQPTNPKNNRNLCGTTA